MTNITDPIIARKCRRQIERLFKESAYVSSPYRAASRALNAIAQAGYIIVPAEQENGTSANAESESHNKNHLTPTSKTP